MPATAPKLLDGIMSSFALSRPETDLRDLLNLHACKKIKHPFADVGFSFG
jgi:hypothetical protein